MNIAQVKNKLDIGIISRRELSRNLNRPSLVVDDQWQQLGVSTRGREGGVIKHDPTTNIEYFGIAQS